MKKQFLLICLIIVAGVALRAEVRTVRVGFFRYPGYHEVSETGEYSGYGYDFLSLVQRYSNLKFEYIGNEDASWSEQLEMLRRGEIDLLTSALKTPERMHDFAFSYSIGEKSGMLSTRNDESRFTPYDYTGYNGMKIGMIQNNIVNEDFEQLAQRQHFRFVAKYYPNGIELAQALENGEVDAIVTSSLRKHIHEKTLTRFDTRNFYAITQKNDTSLINQINEAIRQMDIYEGNWKSQLYYRNYVANENAQLEFTPEEQAFIREHSTADHPLVLATDNSWVPFSMKQGDDYVGIVPDFWHHIMVMTGMTYRYYDCGKAVFPLEELTEGKADIYLGTSYTPAQAERKGLLVSPPFMNVGASMLFMKANPQIQKVALCRVTNFLNNTFLPEKGWETHMYETADDAVTALKIGEVDAVYCYTYDAERLVNNDYNSCLTYKVVPGVNIDLRAVMSIDEDHTLMSIITKCIHKLRGSEIEEIVANQVAYTAARFNLRAWGMAHPWASAIGLLVIILLIIAIVELVLQQRIRATVSRKQAQQLEEIKALNERLKENDDVIAKSGNGIWRICMKEDGKHTMVANDLLRKIFGAEEMNLTPEQFYIFYHKRLDADLDDIECDYRYMEKGEVMTRILEWNHPTKGKIYLYAGGTSYVLPDGSQIISGFCRDITRRRTNELRMTRQLAEAMEEANRANRAKTAFLFNMSHDIRTPMNAILGFVTLMEKDGLTDKDKCLDYLSKIHQSSDFLLSLINEVLEMARIDSGKMQLDEQPCPIQKIKNEVDSVYSDLMQKKGIRYTFTDDIQTHAIYVDVTKIEQIFLNLLSNAYKYTPAGGSVNVAFNELPSDREGYIRTVTVVEDTGIGMSQDYLPHIFEEFTREQTATDNKIQGTGLGLPIVKKLVDLMGGSIEVESQQGKGTRFTVTLEHRIANATQPQPTGTPTNGQAYNFAGKRILLAEDNDLNAEIAMAILSDVGFVVERAEDGIICVDMLNKAAAGYYDVILMDVQMPNLNGYDATIRIRRFADAAKARIPILAMTANAFSEDKTNAIAAGMNGHLSKPIDIPELMKALSLLLN